MRDAAPYAAGHASAMMAGGRLQAPPWGLLRPSGIAHLCISLLRTGAVRGHLRRPLFWLLGRVGAAYDVEVAGLKFRCPPSDNLSDQRVLRGLRREEALRRIIAVLRGGDTFVDIGANCGLFTVPAAKAVGPAGRVVAIEPSPAMLPRLRFNVAANGFDNVHIAPVAAGDARGTAALNIAVRQHGCSSLANIGGGGPAVAVELVPLIDLVTEHGVDRIDAMKIDVEGHEDRVLIPFLESAPRALWPRRLLIEKSPHRWQQDCMVYLRRRGYIAEWQNRKDALLAL